MFNIDRETNFTLGALLGAGARRQTSLMRFPCVAMLAVAALYLPGIIASSVAEDEIMAEQMRGAFFRLRSLRLPRRLCGLPHCTATTVSIST